MRPVYFVDINWTSHNCQMLFITNISFTLRNQGNDQDVLISIVLACRQLDSAYQATKLLSDDIPANGSVRMVRNNDTYVYFCVHAYVLLIGSFK